MKYLLGALGGLVLLLIMVALLSTGAGGDGVNEMSGRGITRSPNLHSAPNGAGPQPREPADPKRARGCVAALKAANRPVPVWKNWTQDENYITVWVRSAYYLTDFQSKSGMDKLLRCAASEGRERDQGITLVKYLDAETGKPVAEWSKWSGFKMDN